MGKYKGISTKIMADGSQAIMVRFKYKSITYPVKNFTALYNCKSEKSAYDKLQEVKVLISQGNNPFIKNNTPDEVKETVKSISLNDFWNQWFQLKTNEGEWGHNTRTNYTYFYNAYIRDTIGEIHLRDITYEDLMKVREKLSSKAKGTKNTLRRLLRPLFEEAINRDFVEHNVALKIKTIRENERADKSIGKRTKEDELSIVRKLYNSIPNYQVLSKKQDTEIRMFLYMVLLTAHRMGEILRLKKENVIIGENKIISPKEITKTKEDYHFPIPDECKSYIESIEKGPLFPTLRRGSLYAIFQRLVKLTDITFYNEKTVSLHDTRRFMLMVMIRNCKIDSRLADTCLSHKQDGVIKHYMGFSYEDEVEAFQKYWKLIRNQSDV